MTAPAKTEGELQCDALLRATDMLESQLIAAAVAETIRGKGPQGRGAIIVGLVHVLLTASRGITPRFTRCSPCPCSLSRK